MSEAEIVEYPHVADSGKRYRVIDVGGRDVIEYESGARKDQETGLFTKPGNGTLWDSEGGTNANNQRHAATREAMERNMVEAAVNGGKPGASGADVAGHMAAAITKHVLFSDATLRDRVLATKTLLQMTDLIPSQAQQGQQLPPGVVARLDLSADLMDVVAKALAKRGVL